MIGAFRSPDDARWYRLALVVLIGAAWLAMAWWGASPHAIWLHHREAGAVAPAPASRAAVFIIGWVVMTVAMMLPGSLPLLTLFSRMVAARPGRAGLLARVGAGYLTMWAAVGVAALAGDTVVHAVAARVVGLDALLPSAVLLAAGAYQFTRLKERCLAACRSPLAFVTGHWRGSAPGREAWALGLHHGLFCVGCCWTLMLVMFAVGVAHLGWMLGLGALMTAERTMPWGRRLAKPAGAALVAWALVTAAAGTTPF